MQIVPLIDPFAIHQDGSKPLTANWNAGAFAVTNANFVSNIAIGTSPYACTSTTLNSNLNADLLDGQHASEFQAAGSYQPLDADLSAIAALNFVSTSFLKKTAADTWALDTTTYLPLAGGTMEGGINMGGYAFADAGAIMGTNLGINADANSIKGVGIRNSNAGALAQTTFKFSNDNLSVVGSLTATSSGFTPVGAYGPSTAMLAVEATNGLVLGVETVGAGIRFLTGGYQTTNERMRIDGDGNIGMGVSDPDTILEILKAGTQLKLSYNATNYITLTAQSDGDLIIDSNKTSYDLDFGDGNLITSGTFGAGGITGTSLTDSGLTSGRVPYVSTAGLLADSANLTFVNNATPTLAIFSTLGKVGIGIANPDMMLDIVDNTTVTTFTGDNTEGIRIRNYNAADNYALLGFSGYNQSLSTRNLCQIGGIFTGNGSALQFGTSNAYSSGITNTAMTIDWNGSVGLGEILTINDATTMLWGQKTIDNIAKFTLENPSTGVNATLRMQFAAYNTTGIFTVYGTNYSDTAWANRFAVFASANSAGLNFGAINSTGEVKLFTGGQAASNVRLYINSAGAASFSSTLGVTGLITATGGITINDAANITVNETTGTKLGTATTQKIGFWNATPSVQLVVAADATVTTLITALTTIGLIRNT